MTPSSYLTPSTFNRHLHRGSQPEHPLPAHMHPDLPWRITEVHQRRASTAAGQLSKASVRSSQLRHAKHSARCAAYLAAQLADERCRHAGNYRAEMTAENQRVGAPTDLPSVHHTLYLCGVGGDGWIQFSKFCGYPKCHDGGWGMGERRVYWVRRRLSGQEWAWCQMLAGWMGRFRCPGASSVSSR